VPRRRAPRARATGSASRSRSLAATPAVVLEDTAGTGVPLGLPALDEEVAVEVEHVAVAVARPRGRRSSSVRATAGGSEEAAWEEAAVTPARRSGRASTVRRTPAR